MMNKKMIAFMASAALTVGLTSVPASADSDPLLGEIMPVAFNFCPRGWAGADGQILPINQYQALYSLYGTIYGGDGRTTFALPDLRSRAPIHRGQAAGSPTNHTLGSRGGVESITLTETQMPVHTHTTNILAAHTDASDSANPKGNAFGRSGALNYENDEAPSTDPADAMHSGTLAVSRTGGSMSYSNRSPFLTIRYCIATQGVFPSRN